MMCSSTSVTTTGSTSDDKNVVSGSTITNNMAESCYDPTLEEAVRFDPTSVGLPEDWSLTEFSTLKG